MLPVTGLRTDRTTASTPKKSSWIDPWTIWKHPLVQLTAIVGLGVLAYACYRTLQGDELPDAVHLPKKTGVANLFAKAKLGAIASTAPIIDWEEKSLSVLTVGCEASDPPPLYPSNSPFQVAQLQTTDTSVAFSPYSEAEFFTSYRDGSKAYTTFYNIDGSGTPTTYLIGNADANTQIGCATSITGIGAIAYVLSNRVTLDVLDGKGGIAHSYDTFCSTTANVYDLIGGKNGDQWLLSYKCTADLHLEKLSLDAQPLKSFVPNTQSFNSAGAVSLSGETLFFYDDPSSVTHLNWLDEDLRVIRSSTTIQGASPLGVEVGEGQIFLAYLNPSSYLARRVLTSSGSAGAELLLTDTPVSAFHLARSGNAEVGLHYTQNNGSSYAQLFDTLGNCLGSPIPIDPENELAAGIGFTQENQLILLEQRGNTLYSQSFPNILSPQIVHPIPNQYADVLAPYSYTIPDDVAVDPNPDLPLTYQVGFSNGTDLSQSWLNFNANTLLLSGTPPSGTENNLLPLSLVVSNGYATNSTDFNLTVTPPPPTLVDPIPDTDVNVGNTQVIPFKSVFVPSDPEQTLTYTVQPADGGPLPTYIQYNSTSLVIAPVSGDQSPKLEINVTAHDNYNGIAIDTFGVTIPNRPPYVANPIPQTTVYVGNTASLNLTEVFADPDPGDSVAVTVTTADGQSLDSVPWVSYNRWSEIFTASPISGDQGQGSFLAIGNDGFNSTSIQFNVTVPARPPSFESHQTVSINGIVGMFFSADSPPVDNPDGDPLTYSLTSNPAWISIDTNSGVVSGTPPNGTQNHNFTYQIHVDDPYGGEDSVEAITQVSSAPPATVNREERWEWIYWVALGIFGGGTGGYAYKKREKISVCCTYVSTGLAILAARCGYCFSNIQSADNYTSLNGDRQGTAVLHRGRNQSLPSLSKDVRHASRAWSETGELWEIVITPAVSKGEGEEE